MQSAQNTICIEVEISILPNPARGEQILPTKKVRKPRIADALPELSRTGSRARVVEVGSIIPRNTNRMKRAVSI